MSFEFIKQQMFSLNLKKKQKQQRNINLKGSGSYSLILDLYHFLNRFQVPATLVSLCFVIHETIKISPYVHLGSEITYCTAVHSMKSFHMTISVGQNYLTMETDMVLLS